ncbi:MAG TPA: ATP-binding cassette domain-containing protein [Actinomycetota bacterium]|nr:ATP-binding cassette domain-containing protein [Actinomycetota bacterium]
MPATSFLKVRDLRFRYPGASHDALSLASLEIDRPGLVAITGPSGAGKSTLIELLAGTINEPYSGSVEVLGKEWSQLRTDRARQLHLRRIALIPQDLGLLPNQTPRQMLVQALLDAGVPRSSCEERVARALGQMEMTAHAGRRIAELSGGQQQRVAIARALARNVDLILADEPTASLNAALVDEAVAVLRRIGMTVPIVMVTHDAAIAAQCDRQIRLTAPAAAEAAPVLILPVPGWGTAAAAPPAPAAPALRPVAAVGPVRPALIPIGQSRPAPAPRPAAAASAVPPLRPVTPVAPLRPVAAVPPLRPVTPVTSATATPTRPVARASRLGALAGLTSVRTASTATTGRPAWRVPHFGILMSAAATGLVALVGVFAIGPLAPSASQRPAPAVATVKSESVPAPSPSPEAPQVASVADVPPIPNPSPAVTQPVTAKVGVKPATSHTAAPKVTTPPAPSPAAVVPPAPAPVAAPTPAVSPTTNALAWWIAMSQLLNTYGGGTNGTGTTGNPTATPSPTTTAPAHH